MIFKRERIHCFKYAHSGMTSWSFMC